MKILITGGNGQLAKSIIPLLNKQHTVYSFSKQELDIRQDYLIQQKLDQLQPDYVLNLAAYNQVDLAETEQEACSAINVRAPQMLARMTYKYNIGLIHISSNYVFSGRDYRLYTEQDTCEPINHYGLSKYQGEQAVLAENPKAIVIRTSSLYSPFGDNFVTKIIKQLKNKEQISVVSDSYTQPTSCQSLALFIKYLIENNNFSGLVHYTDEEIYSWYEYAQIIAKAYLQTHPKSTPPTILPTQLPVNTIRPKYALLDNDLRKDFYRPTKKLLKKSLIDYSSIEKLNQVLIV